MQLRGKGGFAEVWEAIDEQGKKLALKFMSGDATTTSQEVRTIQAIRKLGHPNLIRIDRIWSIPHQVVIEMELAEGSLLDLLDVYQSEMGTPLPAEILLPYFAQAATVLDFLNHCRHTFDGRKVAFQHCDIKPSNFLLLGDFIKLADFGLSTPVSPLIHTTPRCGTMDFVSPEVHRGALSDRSDQYGFAVTYYYLRTGRFPFPTAPDTFARKHSYTRPAPELGLVSRGEQQVLRRALSVHPAQRWENCTELVKALGADWNSSHDGAPSTVIMLPATVEH